MSTDPLPARLTAALGADRVVTDPERLAPHLVDERRRYQGRVRCLVLPRSTAEVAAAVALCAAAGVPLVPQGGNTGLSGGATPGEGGEEVLIGLGRMTRVRALDAANFTITVEAGLTLQGVQQAAAAADRLFPLSLGAEGTCQIGGNVSTNAGGIHVLRYGTTRELVLGLEVVLPDGRVWDGLRGLRKDNSGYDLKQLFIGAEGTLGIVTAATLKLFPLPKSQALAYVALDEPTAALEILALARAESGERVTACEIMGRQGLEFAYRHIPELTRPFAATPPWSLLLELSGGDNGADLSAALERTLAVALERGWAQDALLAQSAVQAAALWKLREAIVQGQKPEGASIKHDVAVPVSAVPAFLAEATAAVGGLVPGLRPVPFGHIGDGNIHFNLTRPEAMDDASFFARGEAIHRAVHDIVRRLGGSISAEHGIGRLRLAENLRTKAPLELELMRRVKQALDPQGIMNPGKVLPPA